MSGLFLLFREMLIPPPSIWCRQEGDFKNSCYSPSTDWKLPAALPSLQEQGLESGFYRELVSGERLRGEERIRPGWAGNELEGGAHPQQRAGTEVAQIPGFNPIFKVFLCSLLGSSSPGASPLLSQLMAELMETEISPGDLGMFSLNSLLCSATINPIFQRGVLVASLGGSRSCWNSV